MWFITKPPLESGLSWCAIMGPDTAGDLHLRNAGGSMGPDTAGDSCIYIGLCAGLCWDRIPVVFFRFLNCDGRGHT